MKFTCISDTHQKHDEIEVPEADIVFHSGDSNSGSLPRLRNFLEWFSELPHKHKVFIAGNHDWVFQRNHKKALEMVKEYEDKGVIYLQDEEIILEGIKIYGSPQTPEFCNWAFNCWRTVEEFYADNYGQTYDYIGKYWIKIPKDTDILLTHGPPNGILDKCPESVGCELLLKIVKQIVPKYHIFGHIHEGRGDEIHEGIQFINASSLDGRYNPIEEIAGVWDADNISDSGNLSDSWGG